MKTAHDIREAFAMCYPEVNDYDFAIKHSAFAHENPMAAIGIVLISSILLGTTEVICEFTSYSEKVQRKRK